MFKRIAVGDIMTRKYASVRPSTNLQQCVREIVKQRVNNLLITEGNKLIGILTARDLLWTIMKKPQVKLEDIKAVDIGTKKVAVIKPSADLSQALNKMKKFGFRRLPVLSRGELVGIVTLKDLLRVDPNIYGDSRELDKIREESDKLKKLSKIEADEWDAEGPCEECDAFAPLLRVDGRLLCPDCRDILY